MWSLSSFFLWRALKIFYPLVKAGQLSTVLLLLKLIMKIALNLW